MNHPADTRNRLKPVGDGPSLLQQTYVTAAKFISRLQTTDGKQVPRNF